MRIGLITDTLSLDVGTGIARYSNQLIRGLEDRGIPVKAIHPDPPDIPLGEIFGHIIKLPARILLDKNDVDIFHALAPVNSMALPFLKKPSVVTYHDLATILYPPEGRSHLKYTLPTVYKLGLRCSRIITVSSQTRDELVRYFNFPANKIAVINPGVEGRFRPLHRAHGETFTLGYIGSTAARKRLDYAIQAVHHFINKYPSIDIRFQIYGRKDGKYPGLTSLIDLLGVKKNIEFYPPVEEKDIVDLYNTFDVFLFPSEWEGFGIPILEAQACGVPVITREGAHIPAEVSECCIKARSEADMADKIHMLLMDDGRRETVIENGIFFSKRFTWERAVESTIRVYEDLAGGKDQGTPMSRGLFLQVKNNVGENL